MSPRGLTSDVIEQLARRVGRSTGMAESCISGEAIRRWVVRWMEESHVDDARESITAWERDDAAGHHGVRRGLIESLLVTETSFYRFAGQLDVLARTWLERQLSSTGSLTAWSAGCSTGQEAYTLAAMATVIGGPRARVRVTGTDLCSACLRKAAQGVYYSRDAGTLPRSLRDALLQEQSPDGTVQVRDSIRRLVNWERADLAERGIDHDVDLVMCRNVLLYYGTERRRAIVRRLTQRLRPGGVLLLGHGDMLPEGPRSWGLRQGDGPATFVSAKDLSTVKHADPSSRPVSSGARVRPLDPRSSAGATAPSSPSEPSARDLETGELPSIVLKLRGNYDSVSKTDAYREITSTLGELLDERVVVRILADEAETLDAGTARVFGRAERLLTSAGGQLVVVTSRDSVRRWASRHGLTVKMEERD